VLVVGTSIGLLRLEEWRIVNHLNIGLMVRCGMFAVVGGRIGIGLEG
jgi:hypothetical protein